MTSFCSKISQSYLKRLMNIPGEHKSHAKYGSGSRSDHERSGNVTKGHQNQKFFFRACGTQFIVTFTRRIKKIEALLQSDPCKSTTEKGQFNSGHIRPNFRIGILNTKRVFLNSFHLRMPKMSFIFLCDIYKCSKLQFEKWRLKDT